MINAIRTFGRTHGKKLSIRQQYLIDNILPEISPKSINKPAILEIGFGSGEHIIELSIQNPDKIIIGAEPFINGVASLLSKITDENNIILPEFKNIRIFPDDTRKLLPSLKNLQAVYILHPDPWPKVRHEKRRLLNSEFLKTLSSLIYKDGEIIIGTDHLDLYDWILSEVKKTNLKIRSTSLNVIKTRYQEKDMFGKNQTKYIILSLA